MSKRAILLLALLALALAAYIAVFERDSVTSKERAERVGRVLVSFVRDKVDRLSIQRKGTRVVLVRKKLDDGARAGFEVKEPFAATADDDAVDQVLGELEWLSARRTLDPISPADEKSFGLDAPRYRVSYEAAGESHSLSVGQLDVHGDGVYVQVDREPRAYVVPKSLPETLAREPGDYREKQLFPGLVVAWAQKVELTQESGALTLLKEQGRWWLSGEPKTYASGKELDTLLHALSELRATRYPAVAHADALFSEPQQRIAVAVVPDEAREDKQAESFTLEIAGACADHPGERYVRSAARTQSASLVACVREEDLAALPRSVDRLRESRLFGAEASAIARFVLVRGKDTLSLARDGEGWKADADVATEQAGQVDRTAVEAWLSELASARAVSFLPLGPFEERGSLTLELSDKKSERIALGDLSAVGELIVRRGDEQQLVSFPGSLFDRLQPTRGRFAPLAVWPGHQPSEVVRVSAHYAAQARVLTLQSGSWRADDPAAVVDS
ncbi:MAG: hypothetical protein JWN48_1609, partial [Myxococcaceae bacterium]|nr:hypothetical protein [Myxococcaceae bacterium]